MLTVTAAAAAALAAVVVVMVVMAMVVVAMIVMVIVMVMIMIMAVVMIVVMMMIVMHTEFSFVCNIVFSIINAEQAKVKTFIFPFYPPPGLAQRRKRGYNVVNCRFTYDGYTGAAAPN